MIVTFRKPSPKCSWVWETFQQFHANCPDFPWWLWVIPFSADTLPKSHGRLCFPRRCQPSTINFTLAMGTENLWIMYKYINCRINHLNLQVKCVGIYNINHQKCGISFSHVVMHLCIICCEFSICICIIFFAGSFASKLQKKHKNDKKMNQHSLISLGYFSGINSPSRFVFLFHRASRVSESKSNCVPNGQLSQHQLRGGKCWGMFGWRMGWRWKWLHPMDDV